MSCEHGPALGQPDASKRHVGGVHCRPATAVATPALEAEWRYDILKVLDGTIVIEIAGEIDLRTGAILRKRLFELTDAGFARIIIDFDGVRFCDAAGLGVLVAAHNRLRGEGGSVSLARVRPGQRRLLEVAGLGRLFASYESVQDAIDAEQRPATTAQSG